ncbi:Hsp33 family molecular chaperone HslO [Paenibacillus sp.]|uniref:Hsp33 family molecular chaperone HslO n=1 Tax=Paenibacillus sp. TaxID=58172 RepID=UPI002824D3E3|nr:Hsp33 family molecular chaperone HslO [Paenibacillus sp.]MDR0269031.1 Hsp33 family molecular chaperone HslO [Paenibacillus sp.]
MEATLAKMMTKDKQARIVFLDNTLMVRELIGERPIDPICAEALATSFTISSLLSGLLKDGQRLSISINTSEPSAYIHCDVNSDGDVRGYATEAFVNNENKKTKVSELIGDKGVIRVTKDIGMGSMYTSAVDMPYKNITDDFSHYFMQSEQVETFFRYELGTDHNDHILYSRGMLFQLFPFAEKELFEKWKQRIDDNKPRFNAESLQTDEKTLHALFPDADVMELGMVRLFCGCSKDVLIGLLFGLGLEELENAIVRNQEIEIACSTCGKSYAYDSRDLRVLIG